MARYRIVCTTQEPATLPHDIAHIIEVGTGITSDKATKQWSLNEVLLAMDNGDTFYTKGVNSGEVAIVEEYTCEYCRRRYIRSKPDAVRDNNLDNLRRCSWK